LTTKNGGTGDPKGPKKTKAAKAPSAAWDADDVEATVNLQGPDLSLPGRDDLEEPTQKGLPEGFDEMDMARLARASAHASRDHLIGTLEALVFAADRPLKLNELTKLAAATFKEVKEALAELKAHYADRGIQLEEVAGGWVFRTNAAFAPFVRDLTKQKPVKLSRAQIETLAILAYRQPITRPEIDDIRGVDSGPVLRVLLERDLVRILGKKDEPGRPLLYGTTNHFLEFFGLKSLRDLPTLKEFTELTEESRRVVENELGDTLEKVQEDLTGQEGAGASSPEAPPPAPQADEAPTVAIARPDPTDDADPPETERGSSSDE
jgi:segregation and condensation protein B